jgi:hypothetical protein
MDASNIKIGDYTTQNFDISPYARIAFGNLVASIEQGTDSFSKLVKATESLDKAFGVIKKVKEKSVADIKDLDEFSTHAQAAEEILADIDDIDNHEYIWDYHETELLIHYEVDMSDFEGLEEPDEVDDDYDDDFSDFDDEDEDLSYLLDGLDDLDDEEDEEEDED